MTPQLRYMYNGVTLQAKYNAGVKNASSSVHRCTCLVGKKVVRPRQDR